MDFVKFMKISSIIAHFFLSILSEINTRTYKLAKFLVPILKSLTSNEYMVKGLFAFAEKTVKQDSQFFVGNLDVDFLFTNFPLEETIDICLNTLFENMEKVGLSKIEFKKLLSLATKENYFFLKESSISKLTESLWVHL